VLEAVPRKRDGATDATTTTTTAAATDGHGDLPARHGAHQ